MRARAAMLIGREDTCDLIVSDPAVSRVHLEVQLLGDGGYYLTDCHSRAGTFLLVDGAWEPVRQRRVGADAVVQVGHTRLNVRELGAVLEPAEAPGAAPARRPPPKRRTLVGGSEAVRVRCDRCAWVDAAGGRCGNCGADMPPAPGLEDAT